MSTEVYVHNMLRMSEQSFIYLLCFHEEHIKVKQLLSLSLRFNAVQILMSPWKRQKRHRIMNY
jgi:hypothetical protein